MKLVSLEGAPVITEFEPTSNLPWIIAEEDLLALDHLTVLPKGTRLKVYRRNKVGFLLLHPETEGVSQRIFIE